MRMREDVHSVYSRLDRGRSLKYVSDDIDGNSRLITGAVYCIGAQEFNPRRYLNDVEIVRISSPGSYLGEMAVKLDDDIVLGGVRRYVEHIMLPKNPNRQTVEVKAVVRNNGQTYLPNVPIVCNASPASGPGAVNEVLYVNLGVSEEKEITFFKNDPVCLPRPYVSIPTTTIPP